MSLFLWVEGERGACVLRDELCQQAPWHHSQGQGVGRDGRVPGPRQDEGEVLKNSPGRSWAGTKNKACLTISSWHWFSSWKEMSSLENGHIMTRTWQVYHVGRGFHLPPAPPKALTVATCGPHPGEGPAACLQSLTPKKSGTAKVRSDPPRDAERFFPRLSALRHLKAGRSV